MMALSIRNPWAWNIAHGFKGVENRDWNTLYRGTFLIHTGLKVDKDAYLFLSENHPDAWKATPQPHEIETGGIIGQADLINVVHQRDAHLLTERDKPWFFGEYGFILGNAKPLPFMPCKGRLGFFPVDYKEPA